MPIMEVHYHAGDLEPVAKADLARRLTAVMIDMEGGADTFGGRAFAWVIFREVPKDDWWVGGETDDTYVRSPGRFLVRVLIPEGYMNTDHKNEVHALVGQAILDVKRPPNTAETGKSILTVIEEVTEGSWGCAGKPIGMASIATSVGLPATSERFGWTTAYFAAKARERRSAGYPADAGGIMTGVEGEAATAISDEQKAGRRPD
ncbi:4-oxalocrotonate tautomerase [Kaistia dalseonensis]|uniref:Phenylpyruvate tautomerase PptA (4-oxalocrotonate tautomerase family) n=1 Tax=Kaistia dalseonensis TaxID=410840 RepID=A0ABU0H981_9HYPH|nr:4-oxalocrotonate tautomerase [Kaistia dalseonensis]MCX5495817.1 4-oxalocrotonate tautomerase [Kaistia dalseonensis]MDQ0438418.1 phenylpyruvate tautomerase PptA (4-oxalocrotonate tautomerase family) [Kaistia dalseonensis]